MNAVGLLGSYISRGVYTVSGPFHPFGGAVDIVVVEQQDGSFKSSPWYVRFGKFQGVLKTKEKVVSIIVNGVEANFQMYLDHKGEAYFLREVDVEGESGLYPSFSGDVADGKLQLGLDGRSILSSKSCNYDARCSIDGIEKSIDSGKIMMKSSSQRTQVLGFAWGRKSIKEDHHQDTSVARVDSLERAEIAADLLEVRWSTNLRAEKVEKADTSKFSSIDTSDDKDEENLKRDDGSGCLTSAVEGNMGKSLDEDCGSCSEQVTNASQWELENLELSTEVSKEMSSLNTKDQVVETSTIGEKVFEGKYEVKYASRDIEQNAKDTMHVTGTISENTEMSSLNTKDQVVETSIIEENSSEGKYEVKSALTDVEQNVEDATHEIGTISENTEMSSLNTKDQVVGTSIICEKAFEGKCEVESASRDIEQNAEDTMHVTGTISENTEMSSLNTKDEVVETSIIGEKAFEGKYEVKSASRDVEQNAEDTVNVTETISEMSSLNTKDEVVETSIIGEKAFEGKYEVKSASRDVEQNAEDTVNVTETISEMSSLNTKDEVVETSIIGEKAFEGKYEDKSASRDIEQNVEGTMHVTGTISENTDSKSQISLLKDCDLYFGENFIGRCLSDETSIFSEDKSVPDGVQSLIFHETSKSSMLNLDDSGVLTHKDSHLANGECEIIGVHTEELHVTTEVHPKDTESSVVAEDFEIETEKIVLVNYSQQVDRYSTCVYEGNTMDQEKPLTFAASHTQIVSTDVPGSVKELQSESIQSSFSSDFQDDKGVDGSVTSKFQKSLNSTGYRVITEESHMMPSTSSDDEQFLFSDFDVSKTKEIGNVESDGQDCNDKEDDPSSIDEENIFVNRNTEICASPDGHEIFNQGMASPITIPQSHPISSKEVERQAASLPNMQAGNNSPIDCEINYSQSHSVDSNSESFKWMELCKDNSSSKSGGGGEQKVEEEQSKTEESLVSEELKSILPNTTVGSPAEATVDPVGNWKLWPFSFKRSNSRKATQSAVDDYTNFDIKKASDKNIGMDGEASIFKHKEEKKMVRSISPTSEQLASLNLKEGGNMVTFTFYTPVLGKQQVDARIYLWKWNTRIVISDVDGTITRSDVLGQFMPFVGMDWSQTGVTNLFSAIKENGYQLLFLSARSISQAYHTRQFLFNLKQDGKALPEGPVVISPDGLFPSLFREVIRRAPHEFKIACLERIRELFPPDCNPFYAGFGNRDTDEFSYLKVGIPRGKIFIINPKGEVFVNRRVDTKSYASLHTLVNGMFPPITSSEQEDFNSWNYWKLPPPMVDF